MIVIKILPDDSISSDDSNTDILWQTVYREVEQNIMPTFLSAERLDFTGKLFNVLNECRSSNP